MKILNIIRSSDKYFLTLTQLVATIQPQHQAPIKRKSHFTSKNICIFESDDSAHQTNRSENTITKAAPVTVIASRECSTASMLRLKQRLVDEVAVGGLAEQPGRLVQHSLPAPLDPATPAVPGVRARALCRQGRPGSVTRPGTRAGRRRRRHSHGRSAAAHGRRRASTTHRSGAPAVRRRSSATWRARRTASRGPRTDPGPGPRTPPECTTAGGKRGASDSSGDTELHRTAQGGTYYPMGAPAGVSN